MYSKNLNAALFVIKTAAETNGLELVMTARVRKAGYEVPASAPKSKRLSRKEPTAFKPWKVSFEIGTLKKTVFSDSLEEAANIFRENYLPLK